MQVGSSTSAARETVAVTSFSGRTKLPLALPPRLITLPLQAAVITTTLLPQATIVKADNHHCSRYVELLVREVGAEVLVVDTVVHIGSQGTTMMMKMVEWEISEVEDPIPIPIQAMDRRLCVTVEWMLYDGQCRRRDRIKGDSFSHVPSQERINVGSLNGLTMCHHAT